MRRYRAPRWLPETLDGVVCFRRQLLWYNPERPHATSFAAITTGVFSNEEIQDIVSCLHSYPLHTKSLAVPRSGSHGALVGGVDIRRLCFSSIIIYYLLANSRRGAFTASFVFVSVLWCRVLLEVMQRTHSAIRSRNLESVDGVWAFALRTPELLSFLIVSIPMFFGVVAIAEKKRALPLSEE